MMDERTARMALASLEPLGAPAMARALEQLAAGELWEGLLAQEQSTSWGRRAAAVNRDDLLRATEACGARFIIPGDEEWLAGLHDLDRAAVSHQGGQPVGLWVRGAPLGSVKQSIALVGARAASSYGIQVATTLAADLAAEGHSIISGLAFGIDAAAHRGALGVRGITVGVLASGIDVPYPAAHGELMKALLDRGSVVSEQPPGARPTRYAFLARNRIIAALADAVVVVEAGARSGAKNTASWANAMGRPLLAVPGPVTSALSSTPHRLIRDGEAILCGGSADVTSVLAPLGSLQEEQQRGRSRPIDGLSAGQLAIREAIGAHELAAPAELVGRTGLSMFEVLAHLEELVELGWLEEENGGFRLPGRPPDPGGIAAPRALG